MGTRIELWALVTLSAVSNHVARAEDAAPEPAAAPEDLPRLVRRLRPSVVAITTSDAAGKPLSIGSGFVVGDGRSVLTNYHVITGASSAVVKLHDGRTIAVDGSFAADPDVDLAVLCVPPLGIPPLKIARGPLPDPGTQVLVIGSPLGLDGTVTDGLVSAVREAENRLQISAPISPGSSGSPVFSFRGEVLGVAVSVVEDAQALNFAIPAASALRLLASAGSEVRPLDFSESERRWARFLADCDMALDSAKFKRAVRVVARRRRSACEGLALRPHRRAEPIRGDRRSRRTPFRGAPGRRASRGGASRRDSSAARRVWTAPLVRDDPDVPNHG